MEGAFPLASLRAEGSPVSFESGHHVRIQRNAPIQLLPFRRFFRGFEKVPAVRELFGARTEQVLRDLRVEFFSSRFGYMGTSDVDGHILISTPHLRSAEFEVVYLDVVHELCHVRQFRQKRPLFYPKLPYVDAPSEIEAYTFTVREGRRIGMTDRQLFDYLNTQWISPAEHRRLARHTGVAVPRSKAPRRRVAR
ncbi:MAG TPA: hypothetical protein VMF04_04925 [Thermoplasmata archaeon]|nr:hypothetical protein [Thermoplasmata archaeon]